MRRLTVVAVVCLLAGFLAGAVSRAGGLLSDPERSQVVAARDQIAAGLSKLDAALAATSTTSTVPGTSSSTSTASTSTTTASTSTSTSTTSTTVPGGGPQPFGVPGAWTQTFGDEFNGTALDTAKWNTAGSWECCHGGRSQLQSDGSYNNGELDYKTAALPANYEEALGTLTIHTLRQAGPDGEAWTGGQLGSKQAFTFGYLETRARFSPVTGFQPALWTWGNGASPGAQETDGYEFYGDNHTRLYLHSRTMGTTQGCTITLAFDPTAAMHVYGVDMESTGTAWYVDGAKVCSVPIHPTSTWNIVDYQVPLAAWRAPPALASTTHADYWSDYVRFFSH